MQREETDDWFWIDQICINQDDQQEKSQQVCRMADLYGKARKVLMWLGTSFEGSDDLMDFIPDVVGDGEKPVSDSVQAYLLQCLRTEDTGGLQRDDDERTEPNGDDRINKFGNYRHGPDAEINRLRSLDKKKTRQTAYRARVEEFRTKYGLACQRLVGLGYFRRVWVIQEITLSSNRVIRIGSKSASWEDVTRFLDYICNPDNRTIDSLNSWSIKRITYLGNIWECGLGSGTASDNQQQERGWYSVLSFVLTSQCTDTRDKAFQCLGYFQRGSISIRTTNWKGTRLCAS
ncbi:hypothetical protein EKO04_008666 [Ascochyta lentis]|uniref:Heterokaryon incompatibility domain-containing protein n=1 Tax=Ascochyta lentis TaxID=205686 RepID=A0A8H7MEF2_9PLEO|nr:hypothetical protein EKO04_008666 [Ascochyta lentis]